MTTHHDIAYRAHLAAVQHLQDLTEAMWAEEDGTDIDWAELGATAPYDGCDDCVVREVATVVIAKLEAAGAIRILDRPDTNQEPDPDAVTLRRDDVIELAEVWHEHAWLPGDAKTTARVRAALGWGDSDDA